jgi:hypothetical protein
MEKGDPCGVCHAKDMTPPECPKVVFTITDAADHFQSDASQLSGKPTTRPCAPSLSTSASGVLRQITLNLETGPVTSGRRPFTLASPIA